MKDQANFLNRVSARARGSRIKQYAWNLTIVLLSGMAGMFFFGLMSAHQVGAADNRPDYMEKLCDESSEERITCCNGWHDACYEGCEDETYGPPTIGEWVDCTIECDQAWQKCLGEPPEKEDPAIRRTPGEGAPNLKLKKPEPPPSPGFRQPGQAPTERGMSGELEQKSPGMLERPTVPGSEKLRKFETPLRKQGIRKKQMPSRLPGMLERPTVPGSEKLRKFETPPRKQGLRKEHMPSRTLQKKPSQSLEDGDKCKAGKDCTCVHVTCNVGCTCTINFGTGICTGCPISTVPLLSPTDKSQAEEPDKILPKQKSIGPIRGQQKLK